MTLVDQTRDHNCHCGKWGAFGHGMFPGKQGTWYCSMHNPDPPVLTEEQRFRLAVPASMRAVNAFAGYLRRKQFEVKVNEVAVRPSFEKRNEYGDSEDVLARRPGQQQWLRFEIKGRSLTFTCRDDFPFQTIIADRASKRTERADWYINVSKDLQYVAMMDGAQRDQWLVEEIFDSAKGYSGQAYMCPKELARFVRIA